MHDTDYWLQRTEGTKKRTCGPVGWRSNIPGWGPLPILSKSSPLSSSSGSRLVPLEKLDVEATLPLFAESVEPIELARLVFGGIPDVLL